MFKPLQVVRFLGVTGIVTNVDGRFVQIMWEEGTHDVQLRTTSAMQWHVAGVKVIG